MVSYVLFQHSTLLRKREDQEGGDTGQTHVASNYLKLFATNNKYSLLYINNFK